ncbi:MAG: DUF5518 domain-containing protein [Methanobacterium sp.]|nr:DUF5518 domain-containing protein [Methanobacterium sp.]
MIEIRPIIIGIITVIALYIVANVLSGLNISLIDLMLAGIAVGFMIGKDIKVAAINSGVFGVIGGIILTILLIIVYYVAGYGSVLGALVNTLLIYLVLGIVVAVVGGVLGAVIKLETEKSVS